jgi:hypothetical protein
VKRFWLLLLAFVMPLQMSWAAIHFCDDAAALVHAGSSHEASAASPVQSDAGDAGDVLGDACCTAAHGCHGLHSLIGQEAPEFFLPAFTSTPADFQQPVARSPFAERHERPQWLAA